MWQHGARLLALLLIATAFCLSPAPHAADARPQDGAPPKGEVMKFSFNESKIFPGTVRDYWVYVPKQYDPAKPAAATESTSAN